MHRTPKHHKKKGGKSTPRRPTPPAPVPGPSGLGTQKSSNKDDDGKEPTVSTPVGQTQGTEAASERNDSSTLSSMLKGATNTAAEVRGTVEAVKRRAQEKRDKEYAERLKELAAAADEVAARNKAIIEAQTSGNKGNETFEVGDGKDGEEEQEGEPGGRSSASEDEEEAEAKRLAADYQAEEKRKREAADADALLKQKQAQEQSDKEFAEALREEELRLVAEREEMHQRHQEPMERLKKIRNENEEQMRLYQAQKEAASSTASRPVASDKEVTGTQVEGGGDVSSSFETVSIGQLLKQVQKVKKKLHLLIKKRIENIE